MIWRLKGLLLSAPRRVKEMLTFVGSMSVLRDRAYKMIMHMRKNIAHAWMGIHLCMYLLRFMTKHVGSGKKKVSFVVWYIVLL